MWHLAGQVKRLEKAETELTDDIRVGERERKRDSSLTLMLVLKIQEKTRFAINTSRSREMPNPTAMMSHIGKKKSSLIIIIITF